MSFRKGSLALWVVLFSIGSVCSADQKIYWNGGGPEPGHAWMKRANIDGTNVESVLDQYNGGFQGIAFDRTTGVLYGADLRPSVFRALSDGSSREDLNSSYATDIEVDAVNGRVFWTSATQSSFVRGIYSSNLDGTDVRTLVTIPYLDICMGLALDVLAGKVYYTYDRYSNHHGEIRVMNTDGTGNALLVDLGYVVGPLDIEIDASAGKLYWRESGSAQVNERLRRANTNGTSVENLLVGPTRLWAYDAIHFDQVNGKFYFAYPNPNGGRLVDIFRANPDGSSTELVLTTDAGQVTYMETATVNANAPPTADAGVNQTVNCTGPLTEVTLDGTASSDPDNDTLSYEWSAPDGVFGDDDRFSPTPTGLFPVGPTLVTLTVTDGEGGVATDDVLITVQDNVPPVVVCTTDIVSLWPPNRGMVDVAICVQASDACVNPENLRVACTVSSSEPDDGTGDGSSLGDVDGVDGYICPVPLDLAYDPQTGCYRGSVALRAEREGLQAGRTYAIVANVTDSSLNSAAASCVVVVPHDKRKK